MRRMPRKETARPKPPFPKKQTAKAAGPATPGPDGAAERALEERIERLEKRLDETMPPGDGPFPARNGEAIDDSEVADPLRRAVDRSNHKRDAGK